jgi:hypothetical protein
MEEHQMRPQSILWLVACLATLLFGTTVTAQPLAFVSEQFGINTGVRLDHAGGLLRTDGLAITLPVQDYILNKEYTFQVVSPGSGEASESYAQISSTDMARGFGSALADGTGALEVGVVNRHSIVGVDVAVSRFNIHLKNSSDQPAYFVFEFTIPAGEVEVIDFSQKFALGHSRVEATIDYLLLSPSGPFGGTYDETTGQLLHFFVDIGFGGGDLTRSDNAGVLALPRSSIGPSIGYQILPFEGIATIPTIPPFGELFLYYDMYALTSTGSLDGILGHARLGDPTDLIGGAGVKLTQTPGPASPVPEPTTLWLVALGLVAMGAMRRHWRSGLHCPGERGTSGKATSLASQCLVAPALVAKPSDRQKTWISKRIH